MRLKHLCFKATWESLLLKCENQETTRLHLQKRARNETFGLLNLCRKLRFVSAAGVLYLKKQSRWGCGSMRGERIQGAPLIIITAQWQSRPLRTDSARQPEQRAHLLLVSLSNEPLIWINGPPARRTLIMASLITRGDEEGWRWRGENGDMKG